MIIHKAFKFRLKPTNSQVQSFLQLGGNSRALWNKLLAIQNDYYEKTKKEGKAKFILGNNLINLIPDLKNEFNWLNLSFSQSLQQVAKNMTKAFRSFFKGLSAYPKFKKKSNHSDSFMVPQKFRIDEKFVFIPKVGEIKWIKHREIEGKIKSLTITQDDDQWFCSVLTEVELEDQPIKISEETIIGVDLGLKEFLVTSDEEVISNPRHLRKAEKKLKREQRRLSKKLKDSKNREKQRKRLRKLHRKVRNQRKDFHHKVSHQLIIKVDGLIFEDLNIQGMVKNHKLSKSINDVGWSQFLSFVKYKCLWGQKLFLKISRWEPSSKTCSGCGFKKEKLSLKERTFICESCGLVIDRDLNAAINIKRAGIQLLIEMIKSGEAEIINDKNKLNELNELITLGHKGIQAFGEEALASSMN